MVKRKEEKVRRHKKSKKCNDFDKEKSTVFFSDPYIDPEGSIIPPEGNGEKYWRIPDKLATMRSDNPLLKGLPLQVAFHLNEQSAAGKLAYLRRGVCRSLGPIPPGLMNYFLAVYGTPAAVCVKLVNVTPDLRPSFSQANFYLFGAAVPSNRLYLAKEKLLDELEKHGIDVTSLRRENEKVFIHTEGHEAGGILLHEGDKKGITVFPGWSIYCGFTGWIIWVWDGHYHIILKKKVAADILAGKFQAGFNLTDAAMTLIHELIHCHIGQTTCLGSGKSESEEEDIVSLIENLIFFRISEDKFRKAGKTKAANTMKEDGDKLLQQLNDKGAQKCIDGLVK